MSNQPLFTPYRMGDLDLPNRIVMAPLTRMRAQTRLKGQPDVLKSARVVALCTPASPPLQGWEIPQEVPLPIAPCYPRLRQEAFGM